jgi:uncharacterized protein GlcG (DUF336 family)
MARVSRFEIDLALAVRMCDAAIDRATAQEIVISVAVVDGGGNLLAFQRMDGAEIAGPTLAPDKAYTAVAHRIGTHELSDLVAPGGDLIGINTAAGGRYIAFAGGLPLWDGDRVIGGVGVSGGTGQQDLACAQVAHEVYARESG